MIGVIFLALLTLMRIGFYSYFNHQGNTPGKVIDAFFLGLRYDLRSVSILLLVILVLGSLPWLHPFSAGPRIRKFWLALISLVALAIFFFYSVDFAHYAYLQQRLNASVLNYLEDAGISMNMVWQSYPVLRIILGLIVGVLLIRFLVKLSWKRIDTGKAVAAKRVRVAGFIICFLVLGFFIFGRFNQYPLRWSDAFELNSDYKASLALNPFESFFNTLRFRHSRYDEKKVRGYVPVIARYFHIPDAQAAELNFERKVAVPAADTVKSRPNVVLVICESFSAYKSSMWGNPLNTTPFFDSLSRQGVFFDHCFTPTYGTARGVWAVITGIPDVESSVTTASRNPAAVDQHTIINDFAGYEKYYFIGGSASWANIRGLLKNNIRGLRLYEQQDYDAPKIDVWGVSDKNLFLGANTVLARESKSFFAVIQTADNHRPYTIPGEDAQAFIKVNPSVDSIKKYGFEEVDELNAFRYTDFCYRKFIEAAKKEKYFDNTIFIFVGDHGINGDAGNMFPAAWTRQQLTSEHVPLLFYSPRLQPRRIGKISSQIDVLPTAAGLCRIPYTNSTLGRDLMDTTLKDFAFIFDPDYDQYGVVKDGYFYRWRPASNKQEMVSATDNRPVGTERMNDMRELSDALYQTARYMILNNKKRY